MIPILFARRTVWYKYCANRVVFSCSWMTLSLQYWEAGFKSVSEQVRTLKFYLICVHVLKYSFSISKCLNRAWLASRLIKFVYFGWLYWCCLIFQIYSTMHYVKFKFKLEACCLGNRQLSLYPSILNSFTDHFELEGCDCCRCFWPSS